jgi:hypothetical protein
LVVEKINMIWETLTKLTKRKRKSWWLGSNSAYLYLASA